MATAVVSYVQGQLRGPGGRGSPAQLSGDGRRPWVEIDRPAAHDIANKEGAATNQPGAVADRNLQRDNHHHHHKPLTVYRPPPTRPLSLHPMVKSPSCRTTRRSTGRTDAMAGEAAGGRGKSMKGVRQRQGCVLVGSVCPCARRRRRWWWWCVGPNGELRTAKCSFSSKSARLTAGATHRIVGCRQWLCL